MAGIIGVYAIRHMETGRIYVGSSKNVKQRWSSHRHQLRAGKEKTRLLQILWNRDGASAFSFEMLEVVADVGDLKDREQFWITVMQSADGPTGFNRHPNSRSPVGFKMSDETRAKMSAMRTGKKRPAFSAAHRAAISAAKTGTTASDEARAKMSAAGRGKKKPPFTEAHREAIRQAKLGTARSVESRAKQSAATLGKRKSPEHEAKLRARMIAMNKSNDARTRTAAMNKARARIAN